LCYQQQFLTMSDPVLLSMFCKLFRDCFIHDGLFFSLLPG
jgi:hypothetical protein